MRGEATRIGSRDNHREQRQARRSGKASDGAAVRAADGRGALFDFRSAVFQTLVSLLHVFSYVSVEMEGSPERNYGIFTRPKRSREKTSIYSAIFKLVPPLW